MEKVKSIKYNFVFNFIRVFSGILFPMLTVPYLSRILQPEGIGKIAFADSIIQYFVLIASLGIPIYGIREIAKVRNDEEDLSKTLSELFLINILMTVIAYIIFIFLYLFVDKIHKESLLFFVMSFNIIFSTLGIEWYYQGVEKYDYITIRSILVRIVSIVLMFLLVKIKQDYIISATIGVVGNVGSNLYNIYGARKLIKIKREYLKEIKRHIKPVIITFSMVIVTSIYNQMSIVILGFLKGEEAVGFFTSSIKLLQIIIALVISLGMVIIPRASFLINNNRKEEYEVLIKKLLSFNLFISFPAFVLIISYSKVIINIFFGEKFNGIEISMMLVSVNIIISSIINLFGQQILYPNNQEKKVLKSFAVGAVISLLFDFVLIPYYSYNGAVIALVITQVAVFTIQLYYVKGIIKFNIIKIGYKFFLAAIIMGCFLFLINGKINNLLYLIIVSCISGILYYVLLILFKEKNIVPDINKIIKKIIFRRI